jgi:hypothetical protein
MVAKGVVTSLVTNGSMVTSARLHGQLHPKRWYAKKRYAKEYAANQAFGLARSC